MQQPRWLYRLNHPGSFIQMGWFHNFSAFWKKESLLIISRSSIFWYSLSDKPTRNSCNTGWPKKYIHSLLINIFGINLNKISISGWECNIMFSQQMAQALMSLIVKTVAQKNVYTLWHEKYYSLIVTTLFTQKQNWYERCPWILDSM